MKEIRSFYVPAALTAYELPADEATHALRVLRMKAGDEMVLMDGQGNYFRAEANPNGKHCYYEIKEQMPQQRQWKGHVHLAIAPTKMMDRIEWMIEKAVEIGLDELSFIDCQFSERRVVKLPRLEKIMISAVKQSHKAWVTQLNEMASFDDYLRKPRKGRYFIAHCYEEVPRSFLFDELRKPADTDDDTVFIGPEGDFSIEEVRKAVDAGFVSVHLGKSRLRTETAGLSAVIMMQLAKEMV